ncbi:MAG: GNAT family N-acetyltransferase [Bacteroides sp.]|nr:GNAT family N-acetyltransferase [Roseburia sp.]MCM1346858.1 GNAT family N-acetyltransferase [Bacteroides sp.]MCM1420042.1 GNAT family N-acetyltransferase [Bacteroides sp.]
MHTHQTHTAHIRLVCNEDSHAIASIYNHYIRHSTATFDTDTVSENDMAERIRDISARYPYLVYEEQGRVLGYCFSHSWKPRKAYSQTVETTVYVHPDCARRGIGELLMRALIEECKIRGFHVLIACITADNEASISLHEKLGFTRVSLFKEVGMKFGKTLDVTDYELILN